MDTGHSLLTSTMLVNLYNATLAPSALENIAVVFWCHLLSKHIFPEEEWAVAPEFPPEEGRRRAGRRRIDLAVRYYNQQSYFAALLLVECKRNEATAGNYENVETEVRKACIEYLQENDQSHVYAMTTVGTRARLWRMFNVGDLADQSMEPMFGENISSHRPSYVDAHYNSEQLKVAFGEIRRRVPVAMAAPAAPAAYWTWSDENQRWFHIEDDGTITWNEA